jgi:hypothetical protein
VWVIILIAGWRWLRSLDVWFGDPDQCSGIGWGCTLQGLGEWITVLGTFSLMMLVALVIIGWWTGSKREPNTQWTALVFASICAVAALGAGYAMAQDADVAFMSPSVDETRATTITQAAARDFVSVVGGVEMSHYALPSTGCRSYESGPHRQSEISMHRLLANDAVSGWPAVRVLLEQHGANLESQGWQPLEPLPQRWSPTANDVVDGIASWIISGQPERQPEDAIRIERDFIARVDVQRRQEGWIISQTVESPCYLPNP